MKNDGIVKDVATAEHVVVLSPLSVAFTRRCRRSGLTRDTLKGNRILRNGRLSYCRYPTVATNV